MPNTEITDGQFWWIAIVIALIACLIDAIGWVIEKSSHMNLQSELLLKLDEEEETTKRSLQYLRSCKWWCGFITHISGTALFSCSLAFTDASLIMPLQSATLAFNTIFAWKFLHEKLNKKQVCGTILIVIGCALAVVVGPKTKDALYAADDLEKLFRKQDFLVFTAFILIIAVIDYVLFKYFITNYTFVLLSYVFKAGFFASWNILFIKCFIEIVISSSNSRDVFKKNGKNWIPYTLFFLICFSKVTSEFWREEALKIYPGNYVGSIYTLFFIVGVILFASIYFNEFEQVEPSASWAFMFCVAMSFVGVMMLTFGKTKNNYKRQLVGDQSIVSPIVTRNDTMELSDSHQQNGDDEQRKNSAVEMSLETEKLMTNFHFYSK